MDRIYAEYMRLGALTLPIDNQIHGILHERHSVSQERVPSSLRNSCNALWLSNVNLIAVSVQPTFKNTIVLFVCPPKCFISIVFIFSWDHCES